MVNLLNAKLRQIRQINKILTKKINRIMNLEINLKKEANTIFLVVKD